MYIFEKCYWNDKEGYFIISVIFKKEYYVMEKDIDIYNKKEKCIVKGKIFYKKI